ncbi:hypothetical protein A1O3_04887 [Capronia epimyces CBS 606.96]|uniref:Uncharacterized protein n=1 Tax=Capronia epimyces CBS 606.96 TaxID=1182542 RepID=W9Y3J4_9EURO|nr:uncharacterized protein A1O3_04887 [Capronia epimyces CBS 606.96]EXJ84220.1 hypothetical protein A1O3_04887 [Capronia epimyces CBS 606.96]
MARHTFTREQIDRYFDRICLAPSQRIYNVVELADSDKVTFLNLLQKHQLCKMPWENLSMHYSWHRVINVRPAYLFKKMVYSAGVGGYCMEANYLFHLILHSLGFDVFMAGSRIFRTNTNSYGGWTHVVNLVTIAGVKYLLDGGMGPNGPNYPMPLHDGKVVTQIAPAQMRLDYEGIAQNLDKSQKVWVYKHRYDETAEMVPVYCFPDFEFLPADIESMNFEPMLNPKAVFARKVMAVRFTTDRETDDSSDGPGSPSQEALEGEIDGSLSLNHDVLKWRRHGKKFLELTLDTEAARLRALKRYFGITLQDEDVEAIHGTRAQVGPDTELSGPP